jgi:hypothetical protein
MTCRASAAKAKVGDEPVFAYIRSLPRPQRAIAEAVDALAAKTLPGLESYTLGCSPGIRRSPVNTRVLATRELEATR